MTGYVWMRIVIVQYYLKSYTESLVAFEKALQFAKRVGDKTNEAFAIKNIGVIYFIEAEAAFAKGDTSGTLKKCEASIENYQAALKIYEKQSNGYWMMETYHPLGNTYEKPAVISKGRNDIAGVVKNTALARENFTAFLQGAEKFNDKNYVSEAYYALGSFFLKQKNTKEAERHLKKGLQISIDIARNGNIKIGYCHLADMYSSIGDNKQAFNYHKFCASYSDTLVNDENKQKALQMQICYEVGKKEDELKLLAAENKLKTKQAQKEIQQKKIAYTGIGALLLLGGYSFYRYTRKKHLQNKQAMTNERLRISSELHDEVGATLSGIAMYSHLIKGQLKSNNVSGVESSLHLMQQSSSQMVDKLNDIV